MRTSRFRFNSTACCKTAALALLLALTLPARASDDRAVKQRVPPVYPELAKRMKITGEVTVQATVDPDGKVTDAKAISGSKTLVLAAEDAVRKWKFVAGPDVSHVDVSVKFEMAP
jgi:TonB family protein